MGDAALPVASDAGSALRSRCHAGLPDGVKRLPGIGRDLDPLYSSRLFWRLGVGAPARSELGHHRRRERPPQSPPRPGQLVAAAAGAGATATPQGALPTGMCPMTLSVSVSTTVTSLDGPFAL